MEVRGRGSTPESVDSLRVRRIGGGAASSESESASSLESVVSGLLSSETLRECKQQKLKKLRLLAGVTEVEGR